jgi:hypothetical protein
VALVSRGLLSFRADEVRLDVDLGDTLLASFPVFDSDDDSAEDLTAYTIESKIDDTSINFQLAKVGTNIITAALTQANLEELFETSRSWFYKIWIVKSGERRRIVKGVLVIYA